MRAKENFTAILFQLYHEYETLLSMFRYSDYFLGHSVGSYVQELLVAIRDKKQKAVTKEQLEIFRSGSFLSDPKARQCHEWIIRRLGRPIYCAAETDSDYSRKALADLIVLIQNKRKVSNQSSLVFGAGYETINYSVGGEAFYKTGYSEPAYSEGSVFNANGYLDLDHRRFEPAWKNFSSRDTPSQLELITGYATYWEKMDALDRSANALKIENYHLSLVANVYRNIVQKTALEVGRGCCASPIGGSSENNGAVVNTIYSCQAHMLGTDERVIDAYRDTMYELLKASKFTKDSKLIAKVGYLTRVSIMDVLKKHSREPSLSAKNLAKNFTGKEKE